MKTLKTVPYAALGGLALLVCAQVNAQTSAAFPSRQGFASPADRDAYSRSAFARGDTQRAAAALNESVRVNPFDPVALNNLAVNYASQGDYQNAVALLERAMRIAPNRSDIVNNHANLRAWMLQDAQYASGNRNSLTPLNFPRAEDSPPEPPPLWSPPQPLQNPPVSARVANPYTGQGVPVLSPQTYRQQAPMVVAPAANAGNARYAAPSYPVTSQQQPAWQQPYGTQAPVPAYPAAGGGTSYGYGYPAYQQAQPQASYAAPAAMPAYATAPAPLPVASPRVVERTVDISRSGASTRKKPATARSQAVDCRVEP